MSFDRIVQAFGEEFIYYSHDLNGVINFVSPSVNKVLGVSVSDFCRHHTHFYTSDPMNDKGVAVTNKVMKGQKSGYYEAEMNGGDGQLRYLEIVKVPAYDFDGNMIGVEGMARDVTKRVNDVARFRGLLESRSGRHGD